MSIQNVSTVAKGTYGFPVASHCALLISYYYATVKPNYKIC